MTRTKTIQISKPLLTGFLLLLLFFGGWFVKARYIDQPILLTVVGEGQTKAKPQKVQFTLSVVTQAETATQSLQDNHQLVKQMIDHIKRAGSIEKDIKVAYARIVPPSAAFGRTNYQAINTIDVALPEINRFEDLVQALYAQGTQSLTNIVFLPEDSASLEKEAVAEAIKDARLKASEIAKASRAKIKRIVSVEVQKTDKTGAALGEVAPPGFAYEQGQVLPAQIEIVSEVKVVFELK